MITYYIIFFSAQLCQQLRLCIRMDVGCTQGMDRILQFQSNCLLEYLHLNPCMHQKHGEKNTDSYGKLSYEFSVCMEMSKHTLMFTWYFAFDFNVIPYGLRVKQFPAACFQHLVSRGILPLDMETPFSCHSWYVSMNLPIVNFPIFQKSQN